jgi:hypothetical protein
LNAEHTPGPWSHAEDGGGSAFSFEIRADRRETGGTLRGIALVYADSPDDGSSGPEDTANAARIVSCVNACDGIEDPTTTIAELRAALGNLLCATPGGEFFLRINPGNPQHAAEVDKAKARAVAVLSVLNAGGAS